MLHGTMANDHIRPSRPELSCVTPMPYPKVYTLRSGTMRRPPLLFHLAMTAR